MTDRKVLVLGSNGLPQQIQSGDTPVDGDGAELGSGPGGGGGGDALTTNPLSQFAATTSAQLAGVISDETGTGALVFANSPALAGTPTTPTAAGGTSTTQIASTAFVTTAVAAAVAGLLELKGSTDCSANPNYPAASKGDTYIVTVAGKIGGASGKSVDVGDVYVASADNAGGNEASVGTSWFVLEHNLAGALLSANNLSDVANAATAATNLGLGTGDSPQLAGVNVGHATDTTITRASAGDVAVEGNRIFRVGGVDVPVADGGTGASDASGARTNLGLGTSAVIDLDTDVNLSANSDAKIPSQKAVKAYVDANAGGGGDAETADPLSQFAATTSAQLAGVITDETGTGALVFANSPALTGTPTTPTAAGGTNTTQVASTAFVTTAVAAAVSGLLELKGSTDCSANPNYPAADKGDSYYVTVAGKIGGASGKSVDVGDVYVASADNAGGTEAGVGTSWFVLEHNLAGALLSANNLSDVANAATAATNLGLGTGNSPQHAGVNVGHATDTTVTRASAGDIAVEGNIIYRAGGTDVPVTDGGTGASTAEAARTNLVASPDLASTWFDYGGDGSVTFDGSTTVLGLVPASSIYTLTRAIVCTSITINSGVTIITNGYQLFCTGTITNNGTIQANGNSAGNASGATGGTAGAQLTNTAYKNVQAGVAGTNGTSATAPSNGAGGLVNSGGLGGSGGGSGGGGDDAGGANGTSGSVGIRTRTAYISAYYRTLLTGFSRELGAASSYLSEGDYSGRRGQVGGRGAGDGANSGGGGGGSGSGAGTVVISASSIVNGASGVITAIGGNGGNGGVPPTGNCGGGGGGGGSGGGVIALAYKTLTNSGTISAAGGTKGTGGAGIGTGTTGSDGTDGEAGTILKLNLTSGLFE